MKKTIAGLIGLLAVLGLTGCGSNEKTLTCSAYNKGDNMAAEGTTVYTFKDDKLASVKFEATFKDITIDNLDSQWATLKAQFQEQNVEVSVDGYKKTTSADDKKYEFTVKAEADFEKMSDETIQENNLSVYQNKSYDELKEYSENTEKLTCK